VALPWNTLDTVPTADGPLVLRQRGERDFLITIAGRVLMTSTARRSEEALATLALGALPAAATPRVLIGGLGMGYTLRAALEVLPAGAKVDVAELTPAVVRWCRGPLAPLTDAAVADRRVRVHVGDVRHVDDEAVLHVALQQPLVGLVDLLHRDELDVGGDVVLAAEVEHLLGLADAADERAGDRLRPKMRLMTRLGDGCGVAGAPTRTACRRASAGR
jgi:hypothetical protein